MFKLVENKRVWRGTALVLLVIAMFGPWAYDLINVPAQYPCELPNVRLEGDFCGLPMSFLSVSFLFFGSFIYAAFGELVYGLSLSDFVPILLLFLFALPFFTTLGAILGRNSGRWRAINLVVLVLAAVAGAWFLAQSRSRPHSAPWGVVLYVIVALGMLAMELSLSKLSSGFRSNTLANNRYNNGK